MRRLRKRTAEHICVKWEMSKPDGVGVRSCKSRRMAARLKSDQRRVYPCAGGLRKRAFCS
jgi:hypothetical protein